MAVSPYGQRTTVTVTVPNREALLQLNHALHTALGSDMSEAQPNRFYLPADLNSFGLTHPAIATTGGTLVDVDPKEIRYLHYERLLMGLSLSKLSGHFGWILPEMRLEFVTQTGEDYKVTVSYDSDAEEDDDWKIEVINQLLDLGVSSVAKALTPFAARSFPLLNQAFEAIRSEE